MQMIARTRFAPSPTGRMHLGHVLAARVAHAVAGRSIDGCFLLRHEDIDSPRVREEFYAEIENDLLWLGLAWDEPPLRQTSRTSSHKAALGSLEELALVYPCFCTRKEIQDEWARMGAAPHGNCEQNYPGTCRDLTAAEKLAKIASGTPFAWRLNSHLAGLSTGPLTIKDLRHGTIPVNPNLLGDVILARKDIGCAYHLAVVVDDTHQQVTHVTRGEDLLPSTHVHRLLQALLDLPEPFYLHHPLMLDEAGERLAKRSESCSIKTLRDHGHSPSDVLRMTQQIFDISMDHFHLESNSIKPL